jgi:hypothetical protein
VDLVRREVRLSGVIDGAEIDLDTREVFGGDRRSAWRRCPRTSRCAA